MEESQPSEVIYQTARVRIRFERGTLRRAAISFTGVGLQLGGLQLEEFRNSLAGTQSVYYVTDLRRHWYNGCYRETVEALNAHLAGQDFEHVYTLGNSMGGTGALLFAEALHGCKTAIAFCPQSSVHPQIASFEPRWMGYRDTIEIWNVSDPCEYIGSNVACFLFYGRNDRNDLQHANRFLALAKNNLNIVVISRCGHNVAQYLKSQGVAIRELIDVATLGTAYDVSKMLGQVPHEILRHPI